MVPWTTRKSALSFSQKIEHFNHGLDRILIGVNFLLMPLGAALLISIIVHKEKISVPIELWIVATVIMFSSMLINIFIYRYVLKCPMKKIFGAIIASRSLSYIITIASVSAIFKDTFNWKGTNKFKELPSGLNALMSVMPETILGCLLVLTAVLCFILFPVNGLFLMILLGLIFKSFDYFAATYMAVLSDRELQRLAKVKVPSSFVTSKLRAIGACLKQRNPDSH